MKYKFWGQGLYMSGLKLSRKKHVIQHVCSGMQMINISCLSYFVNYTHLFFRVQISSISSSLRYTNCEKCYT